MRFLKANQAFLIPVLIFILTGMLFLGLYDKDEIHLYHNQWCGPISNIFFKYLTYLGDGWIFLLVAILSIFKNWRALMVVITAALLTLFVVGGLKQQYKQIERPVKYFENKEKLHLVKGVENHSYKSFPSGHTTTALAALGVLAFMIRSKKLKVTLAILALAIGYSRMHISQHFLIDVEAGVIIGTLIALFSWALFNFFLKLPWAQKSILKPH